MGVGFVWHASDSDQWHEIQEIPNGKNIMGIKIYCDETEDAECFKIKGLAFTYWRSPGQQ